MRPITPALLLALLASLAAPREAAAAEPLRVDGSALGPDGAIAESLAQVTGGAGPSVTPLLVIDAPRIEGTSYQITGTVRYENVEDEGYLEMWSHFPDGSRYFSRTLDVTGPMARLAGSSRARPFALPFFMNADTPAPTRLELNVALPGRGRVTLESLRLSSVGGSAGAWWTPRSAGLVGGIGGSVVGVLGGVVGILCSLGVARRLVEGLLWALLVVGITCLVGGVAALALGQPYAVYYPLLLGGVLDPLIAIFALRTARKRYEAIELRTMQACDLR